MFLNNLTDVNWTLHTILKQSKQNNNSSERHLKSNRSRQEVVPHYKFSAIFTDKMCLNIGKLTQVLFSNRFSFRGTGLVFSQSLIQNISNFKYSINSQI